MVDASTPSNEISTFPIVHLANCSRIVSLLCFSKVSDLLPYGLCDRVTYYWKLYLNILESTIEKILFKNSITVKQNGKITKFDDVEL